ncbi:MAG: GNAT family N-acetyltransferase [Ectothiorhodospiraceae bacterium]|nr:GNAT family N-acetyltransferase [Ectothiorhodospiraceae bacterium]MCH8504922.1 GNAT family N-acetyltransferase [Ectothiorhodospiraceae bacterium]
MNGFDIRQAAPEDLEQANQVVEQAVMSWNLAERVKRLSLPLYQYSEVDLAYLTVRLIREQGIVAAVAAWEPAEPAQLPPGCRGLLLHGLYVRPACHGRGYGRALLRSCADTALEQGLDGVLVRVQQDAVDFFRSQGLEQVPVREPDRDYALRYWLAL